MKNNILKSSVTLNINTSTLSQGIYLVKVLNKTLKSVIIH